MSIHPSGRDLKIEWQMRPQNFGLTSPFLRKEFGIFTFPVFPESLDNPFLTKT
jgi:hypothetical protein